MLSVDISNKAYLSFSKQPLNLYELLGVFIEKNKYEISEDRFAKCYCWRLSIRRNTCSYYLCKTLVPRSKLNKAANRTLANNTMSKKQASIKSIGIATISHFSGYIWADTITTFQSSNFNPVHLQGACWITVQNKEFQL